jgi:hypothetical protein
MRIWLAALSFGAVILIVGTLTLIPIVPLSCTVIVANVHIFPETIITVRTTQSYFATNSSSLLQQGVTTMTVITNQTFTTTRTINVTTNVNLLSWDLSPLKKTCSALK